MGKFKNQDGLREPTGWPPNVTEKEYYCKKKWRPEAHFNKRGAFRKAIRVGKKIKI